MLSIPDLLIQSLENVWSTFTHTWPFLLVSILISVVLRLYTNPQEVSAFLTRYRRVGVIGATVVAVTTPLCSGGTTAVILGMLASTIPWAPIVAFMVASPLTSPEELIYSAGLFGWPFAIAFFVSSILLGLMGGMLAEFFEARGWFANQARFTMPGPTTEVATMPYPAEAVKAPERSGRTYASPGQNTRVSEIRATQPVLMTPPALAQGNCGGHAIPTIPNCDGIPAPGTPRPGTCGTESRTAIAAEPDQRAANNNCSSYSVTRSVTARRWDLEIFRTGRQLLVMFVGFAFLGYVLNGLIPSAWVAAVFGTGNAYSVPLAATLGLPFYINTEGSLPLVRALLDGGMSQGAALAFLISGAGTSLGAIAGALTIARWRVVTLVIGTLWVGAMLMGYAYDLLLAITLLR